MWINEKKYKRFERRGFALISTISLSSLALLVTLAILSLSSVTQKQSSHQYHVAAARANAQLALTEAVARLQMRLGKDQSVCAEAAIFETHDDPQSLTDETTYTNNRHWLGAWDTTVTTASGNYPVVGKKADLGGTEPYRYKAIYTDLRHTEPDMAKGLWKEKLRRSWLVSKGEEVDYRVKLIEGDDAVELVGKGTLGDSINTASLMKEKVVVPVIGIRNEEERVGGYAYWITNNNLKAKVGQSTERLTGSLEQSEIITAAHLGAVKDVHGNRIMTDFHKTGKPSLNKGVSSKSLELMVTGSYEQEVRKQKSLLKRGFHDFTHTAYGLHTNVQLGGFKRDLTPLLSGQKSQRTVSYTAPNKNLASFDFVSSNPIIPGERRAVMGPSFDALRHWGLKQYSSGLGEGKINAETSFASASGYRGRPSSGWARGMSDGVAFESSNWASEAPKLYPVMTEARYHYYLSYSGSSASGDSNIRTHIMPRVCLWNPYSVTMKMPKMVVLMPNPFTEYNGDIEILLDSDEVARLKAKYQSLGTTFDPLTGKIENLDIYASWSNKSVNIRGHVTTGSEGYMPDSRFLGFELEASTLEPGQCLVFSPSVKRSTTSASGVNIQEYNKVDVSQNLLSAREPQALHHFYHDYAIGKGLIDYEYFKPQLEDDGKPVEGNSGELVIDESDNNSRVRGTSWTSADFFKDIDFSKAHTYKLWVYSSENWVFSLKAANGSTAVSADAMAAPSAVHYPTLQIINNGNGGTNSYNFWYYSWFFGTSETASNGRFGYLQQFKEAPNKTPPRLHHVGTKMTYLDESQYEANSPPLRVGRWKSSNVAYHFPIIAHGNVRPHIVTRSASSQSGKEWYLNVHGSWLQSFNPSSVDDSADTPELDTLGYFSKSPFGGASDFDTATRVPMFDLPDHQYGALSLGTLRHVSLSPYSWHPTYAIGSSVADLGSPSDSSANSHLENVYTGAYPGVKSSFTLWSNGSLSNSTTWGPVTKTADNQSLLQLGAEKTAKWVDGKLLHSSDELLTYDLSFEVNHNLWDHYFLSGMPLTATSEEFKWSTGDFLYNRAYSFNHQVALTSVEVETRLKGEKGLGDGFWNNGYYLKNELAFNVNSTSLNAWVCYLSGLRDKKRAAASGEIGGEGKHLFRRVRRPLGAVTSELIDPTTMNAYTGGRILEDDEIELLANCIVREVKMRGPFLSLSDFINRRLTDSADETSKMGAIEAAIVKSGLNSNMEHSKFLSSTDDGWTNNHIDWRPDYQRQVKSKNWGVPSYLIQSDILTPLAPLLSVRGDTFTIRTYGESRANGKVVARAYLEATVIRSPEYVEPGKGGIGLTQGAGNRATDPAIRIETGTAVMSDGVLSPNNRVFGRKFIIVSKSWLTQDQI